MSFKSLAGNWDGTGMSEKVYQKKNVLHDFDSYELLHKDLLELQSQLKEEDAKVCLEKGLDHRKIFGFLQKRYFYINGFSSIYSELVFPSE